MRRPLALVAGLAMAAGAAAGGFEAGAAAGGFEAGAAPAPGAGGAAPGATVWGARSLPAGVRSGRPSVARSARPTAAPSAPPLRVRVAATSQRALLRTRHLRVRVRSTRRARITLSATARTRGRRTVRLAARRTVTLRGRRTISLRLTRAGRRAVASCRVTRIGVTARSVRVALPRRVPAFTGATTRVRRTVRRDSRACRRRVPVVSPTEIRAGAASADLTPPIGTPMFAYTARSGLANPENTPALGLQLVADPDSGLYAKTFVASRGIHTRVRARAIVLETPAGKFALVQVDLGGIPFAMTQEVLRRLEGTGLRDDRVLISATHTHSSTGPIWPGDSQGYAALGGDAFDARVFALTADGIAEAIRAADARLAPARVGIGSSEVRGASRNRNKGPFARNADVPRDAAEREEVSINPSLSVIRVDTVDGRPLGAWSNFAIHPTSFGDGNLLFSGDNPGFTERIVEEGIRRDAARRGVPATGEVVNVWTNSAEGDVSPNGDPDQPGDDIGEPGVPLNPQAAAHGHAHTAQEAPKDPFQYAPNSFGRAHLAGMRVARGVLRAWEDAGQRMRGAIALDSRQVYLRFDGTQADGEPVGPLAVLGGGVVDSAFCSPVDGLAGPGQGRKYPGLAGVGLVPDTAPVSVWRVGPLGLAAFSMEVTTQMGRRITGAVRANAGGLFERVALVGMTNAYQSYTSTPEEYDACEYEGSFTLWGRRQGPRLRDVATALARALSGAPLPPSAPEPPALLLPQVPAPAPEPTPEAGTALDQPAPVVRRFGRAEFRWRGGNPQVDAPRGATFVALQRQAGDGSFSTVATEDSFYDTVERDDANVWTERFQFTECTPEGTYRFRVTGRADRGAGPEPYELDSRPFRVERLDSLQAGPVSVQGRTAAVRALYPDPGKDILAALPRRVLTGSILLRVQAPGRRATRVWAQPDGAGTFTAPVRPGATATVLEVRDGCGNTGR